MDSVESVRAWRARHMNPAHMKPEPVPDVGEKHLLHAQRCMASCAQALAAGVCIEVFAPVLRPALAAVPPRLRDKVGLDLEVMRVLLAPVLPLLVPKDTKDSGKKMTDEDAQDVGQTLYAIAAGEITVTLPP